MWFFSCFLNITERSQRSLKRSIVFVWLCCRNQLNWWLYPTDNAAGKSEVKLIFSASSQRETGAGEELKVSKDKDNFFVSLCSNPPHYFLIIAKLLTKKQVKQNTQHIKKNNVCTLHQHKKRVCVSVFGLSHSEKWQILLRRGKKSHRIIDEDHVTLACNSWSHPPGQCSLYCLHQDSGTQTAAHAELWEQEPPCSPTQKALRESGTWLEPARLGTERQCHLIRA